MASFLCVLAISSTLAGATNAGFYPSDPSGSQSFLLLTNPSSGSGWLSASISATDGMYVSDAHAVWPTFEELGHDLRDKGNKYDPTEMTKQYIETSLKKPLPGLSTMFSQPLNEIDFDVDVSLFFGTSMDAFRFLTYAERLSSSLWLKHSKVIEFTRVNLVQQAIERIRSEYFTNICASCDPREPIPISFQSLKSKLGVLWEELEELHLLSVDAVSLQGELLGLTYEEFQREPRGSARRLCAFMNAQCSALAIDSLEKQLVQSLPTQTGVRGLITNYDFLEQKLRAYPELHHLFVATEPLLSQEIDQEALEAEIFSFTTSYSLRLMKFVFWGTIVYYLFRWAFPAQFNSLQTAAFQLSSPRAKK